MQRTPSAPESGLAGRVHKLCIRPRRMSYTPSVAKPTSIVLPVTTGKVLTT